MATQTGTWTDVHNFATLLDTFATTNGWTRDKQVIGSGVGGVSELYLHKGTNYVSMLFNRFASSTRTYRNVSQVIELPRVTIYGNTGFNTGNTVSAQPGSSFTQTNRSIISNWWFGGRYWFFTNATGDYIHCVITRDIFPGNEEYQHLVFGTADPLNGTSTDGQYIDGSYWDQSFRYSDWNYESHSIVFDGTSTSSVTGMIKLDDGLHVWKRFGRHNVVFADSAEWAIGGTRHDGIYFPIDYFGHEGTYRTSLVHNIIICPGVGQDQNDQTDKYAPYFRIKDTKTLAMFYVEPEGIINDGVDDWQVFPAYHKQRRNTFNTGFSNSGLVGIAYKVI